MLEINFSRRGVLGAGLLALSSGAGRVTAAPATSETVFGEAAFSPYAALAGGFDSSLEGAYEFLNAMMDAYVGGQTVRLIQSYSDQGGLQSTAFTYDNAVAIHAYLARSKNDDLARAELLGKGLLHAQASNFPLADGRFGQAYFVNAPDGTGAYITPAAYPFYFYTSAVGDQCWAGMALAQLYKHTGNNAYLNGALMVANWIVKNTYNTIGPGGFSFGTNINQFNQSVPSGNGKSTEHNIDAYAFFTMLATLTHGKAQNGMSWSALANHAVNFVWAMYNSSGGFFYTGTETDQATPYTGNIPEDVQTWSYLATFCNIHAVSIDWVVTHLLTVDTPSCPNTGLGTLGNIRIEGETFATASLSGNPQSYDPHAVWLEGTAHTATALLARKKGGANGSPLDPGDITTAVLFLENLKLAQQNLGIGQTAGGTPLTGGRGLVAATGKLDTGFGYGYFPNLHIGATGWYLLALRGANPFQLGY